MAKQVAEKNRKEIIQVLHIDAEKVLDLKKTHRQKRPIVIEFSGSPKAGKTSCINSLAIFLKRNRFQVEIINERASVCPVSNKQSPMFNIWTSCMSISGMIGILERKNTNCDVLILDRGIFDSLCWFHWLSSNNLMESKQRDSVESFLMTDALTSRIDIIFAFSAAPKTSIEREYANLLTDEPGTIMNIDVLQDYLNSIQATIQEKRSYFHSIVEIDTTDKNQDEVGKEVTEKTLNILRDLLMERIGYFVLTNDLKAILKKQRVFAYDELSSQLRHISFEQRDQVETNSSLLQPLPIAVITDKDHKSVLSIKKSAKAVSDESPEKDKLLLYVGGHPRSEDFTENSAEDFLAICRKTLRREISEEIGVSLAIDRIEPFLIYTPDSEKSSRHIAVCFLIEVDINSLKLHLDPQELIMTKGTSKSGRFQDVSSLLKLNVEYEAWSYEIMKYCFNLEPEQQTTIIY